MSLRLKRQLHLTGERVVRMPPRVVAGAPRRVLRVSVPAQREDLASIDGVRPFSALRGMLDFVDLPIEAMREARSLIKLTSVDDDPSSTFHGVLHDPLGLGRDLESWRLPIEIFLTLEPPRDPEIDPTDPWIWHLSEQAELQVLGIAVHPE